MKQIALYSLMTLCILTMASAQEQTPSSLTQSVAVNPIFLPFGTATVEYERLIAGQSLTAGVSAWYEYDNVKARWVYAKCMYYPGGAALEGLSFGPTAGYLVGYRKDDEPQKRQSEGTATVGAMVQYNWLFGSHNNILAGIGVGGRAALKPLDDASPMKRVDADVRLVLGIIL
jgi:hypothetical protein